MGRRLGCQWIGQIFEQRKLAGRYGSMHGLQLCCNGGQQGQPISLRRDRGGPFPSFRWWYAR